MPIYRCNNCGFISEDSASVGGKVPCGKCGTPSAVFATAFFVEKLTERYLAMRRELDALKRGEEEEDGVAAAQSVDASISILKDDLHNTRALATAEQHKPLQEWFAAKQIKATFDFNLVDTTGFFDEAAAKIGDHYAVLGDYIERVRFAYRKDHSWVKIDLSKKDEQSRRIVTDCLRELYGQTFFSRYTYKKVEKEIGLGIQSAPAIRYFFEGGWLEWYVFITFVTLCVKYGKSTSFAHGAKIELLNEEKRELDIAFLVAGKSPVIIECKSGEFRSEIAKYVKLRRQLGIDKNHLIICNPDLADEEAISLTAMYDVTFVNLASLKSHLEKSI